MNYTFSVHGYRNDEGGMSTQIFGDPCTSIDDAIKLRKLAIDDDKLYNSSYSLYEWVIQVNI
jgi:hypothetical protein